jgi:predicted transcriptional regulator
MNTLPAPDREVGRVVAEMLDQAGISRKRASEVTGIPRATLLRRLNGASFQILELRAIAEMLGVTIAEIVSKAERPAA